MHGLTERNKEHWERIAVQSKTTDLETSTKSLHLQQYLLHTSLSNKSLPWMTFFLKAIQSILPYDVLYFSSASLVADSYSENNEKTIEHLIKEIRSRLDWIGVDFLDSDAGDEEDDEIGDADEDANDEEFGGVIKRKVCRLLDYACGPGMISRAFAPNVSRILGIDLSESMVSVYNRNAHNQGLTQSFMSASVGNLLDPADPSPTDFVSEEWFNFNLAVVGFGFHHFEDPTYAATKLAERLKTGGVLMIVDFLPHGSAADTDNGGEGNSGEGSSHSHGHGVGLFHGHGHGHSHGEQEGSSETAGNIDQHRKEPEASADPKAGDEGFQKVMQTIAHAGFSEDSVKAAFEKAGVGKDFAFDVLKKEVVFRNNNRKITRQVFFARGTKA